MAGETSAPVNAEEQVEGENPIENIQDLVKQQNDRINQIATQLESLMEQVTGPNEHPLTTPSASNRRDPHTYGARIDQITAQIQELSQKVVQAKWPILEEQSSNRSRETYDLQRCGRHAN